ncbi:cellulase family glycosylhydrolase [Longispora sp. NPDC051575]|uniref:glycoside hydrolase 5 family protein n=1 Tax=Longispora sp. NPDC051575 TaxID=3154943 RepID=UPI003421B378
MLKRSLLRLPGDRVWLGANYWSAAGGPFMWRAFDEATVRRELAVLADHGLDTVRNFCFWPDLMPRPDFVDPDGLALQVRFAGIAAEYDIGVVPTFLVGHMSGQNYDVPWRNGRDLYTDGWMLGQQAYYINTVTKALKDEPNIVGWLISNEMPQYADEFRVGPPDHADVLAWARICTQAVRAAGATQPVSLGDGAWGLEVSGRDNGYRLRELRETIDFAGPHVYPMGDDVTRLLLRHAWACELSQTAGLPVILEEFGATSTFSADKHVADVYRVVLATSLLAGASGWIAWNNTDFALPDQRPYTFRGYEVGFGLTTPDGVPKPALGELKRFRELLDAVDFAGCSRVPSEVGLLISSYLDEDLPMTVQEDSVPVGECGFQSWISARAADLSPAVVRERELGDQSAKLWLVPCAKALQLPTWGALRARAEAGATVYASYFAGVDIHQRGPWWRPDEVFGVESELFYGQIDPVVTVPAPGAATGSGVDVAGSAGASGTDPVRPPLAGAAEPAEGTPVVLWTFERDFGDIPAGSTLAFPVGGSEHTRSRLPVSPGLATVVARDSDGHPALLVTEVGAGRMVLSTIPVEAFAAYRPNANPDPTWRLYRALAAVAGVTVEVSVDDPRVLVDTIEHSSGARYAWLVNPGRESVTARFRGTVSSVTLSGEPIGGEVTLPSCGVGVVRL